MLKQRAGLAAWATLMLVVPLAAQWPASWTAPIAPHHIAGNLYYVGSDDLASYLVVTTKGNILINSSLEASVPLIRESVEKLDSGSPIRRFCSSATRTMTIAREAPR